VPKGSPGATQEGPAEGETTLPPLPEIFRTTLERMAEDSERVEALLELQGDACDDADVGYGEAIQVLILAEVVRLLVEIRDTLERGVL
jgi:hypothetical protein